MTNLPTGAPHLDERTIGLEKIEYLIVLLQTKLERLRSILNSSSLPDADKTRIIGLVAHTHQMIDRSIRQLEHLRTALAAAPASEEWP